MIIAVISNQLLFSEEMIIELQGLRLPSQAKHRKYRNSKFCFFLITDFMCGGF